MNGASLCLERPFRSMQNSFKKLCRWQTQFTVWHKTRHFNIRDEKTQHHSRTPVESIPYTSARVSCESIFRSGGGQ